MGDLPIAVEFRNPSWYEKSLIPDLMDYLTRLQMTHVIADEPHRLNDGVPFVPETTTPSLAVLRLHGRNEKGWFNQSKDWRGQRTLYRYSADELNQFADVINHLTPKVKEVCVIFNNNSNRDAAPNALELQQLMGISWDGLGPQQLSLF